MPEKAHGYCGSIQSILNSIKENPMKLKCWSAIAGVALLVSCGGGGGGDGGAPVAPPPPVSKSITAAAYLDPAMAGVIGTSRVNLALVAVTAPFTLAVQAGNDAPGSYNCPDGGSVVYTKAGTTRTFAFNNCIIAVGGTPMTYSTGSISSTDLTTGLNGTATVLTGGTFNFNSVNVNFLGTGAETWSGTLTFAKPDAATGTFTGGLSVLRNGRTDQYTSLNLRTTVSGGATTAVNTFALASPRITFGLNVENVTANNQVLSKAADNSAVQAVFSVSGASYTFGVYASYAAGATADSTQTLSINDAALNAAFQRILQ
jgi:hypothetical protein